MIQNHVKITLTQIEKDIADGKSKMIFHSSRGAWWTHLESDLEEARNMGMEMQKERHREFMKRDDVSEEKKLHMAALMNSLTESDHQLPLDPFGCPLFQVDDPAGFIAAAKKNADHYGEHGLEAFVFAHHQNLGRTLPSFKLINVQLSEWRSGRPPIKGRF